MPPRKKTSRKNNENQDLLSVVTTLVSVNEQPHQIHVHDEREAETLCRGMHSSQLRQISQEAHKAVYEAEIEEVDRDIETLK